MENQLLRPSHHCWLDYNATFSLNILEEDEYGGLEYKLSFGVYTNGYVTGVKDPLRPTLT